MSENKNFSGKAAALQSVGRPGGPPGRPTERVKLKDSKGTILRLWNYLSNNTFAIIMAFLFVIINAVLTIIASYMVRPIINGLLTNEGMTSLIKNLIIMGLI